MRKLLSFAVVAAVLMTLIFLGYQSYIAAKKYEDVTESIQSTQDAKGALDQKIGAFFEQISGGIYVDKSTQKKRSLELESVELKGVAHKYVLFYTLTLASILLLYFILEIRVFVFTIASSALITLIYGLITPILMISIYSDVALVGEVVLSWESNSVITSIDKLYTKGDTIVASVIALFSVIIPALKVLSLIFITLFVDTALAQKIVWFFRSIGKWSMVDVFVVALFLVFLTTNSSSVSRAEIEIGYYLFLAYVILSMITTIAAQKMLDRRDI